MVSARLAKPSLLHILRLQAANLLTVGRLLLLFVAGGFAVSHDPVLARIAVPIAIAALLTDWLDGVAARRWHTDSKIGGVLDIAGDRIVENVWWVTFAWLRLIPLWVPVIVVARGFLTDAIRSCALSRGQTAFGEQSMMRGRIGYAVVASRASRAIYGGTKVLAFTGLFCLNAIAEAPGIDYSALYAVAVISIAATYVTVLMCLVRSIPVFYESRHLFSTQPDRGGHGEAP